MTIDEAHEASPPKPRWRGRLHQIAFFASLPAGVALVAVASGVEARVVATIFAVSITGLYGTSALYHRGRWSERGRYLMQRLDHSMIFVLIAGTYTPLTLLALRPAWGITLLCLAWTGAAVGITLKFLRLRRMRHVGDVMYIGLGWLIVIATPQLLSSLGAVQLALIVTGGVLYTVGSIVLASRRPDPDPRVFGYHEVWHAFVVAAGLCHYVAIFGIVR